MPLTRDAADRDPGGLDGMAERVAGDDGRARRAAARALVLYQRENDWSYAIYDEAGIEDGVLQGASRDAAPEEAQARLLAQVQVQTGRSYDATWSEEGPHGWTARPVPRP